MHYLRGLAVTRSSASILEKHVKSTFLVTPAFLPQLLYISEGRTLASSAVTTMTSHSCFTQRQQKYEGIGRVYESVC